MLFIIQALILLWIQLKKPKIGIKEIAGLFGDKEFDEQFIHSNEGNMQDFGEVIKQYHLYKTDKPNELLL